MGIDSYIFVGKSSVDEKYHRDTYDSDEVDSVGTSQKFAGKVTSLTEEYEKAEAIIDISVRVSTVAKEIREESQQVWKEKKRITKITSIITVITGAAALAGGIALAVLMPELLALALTVSAVALVLLGVSGLSLYRNFEARWELKNWACPIERACHQRQKLGSEGFFYALDKDLKGAVVSEKEVQNLWHKQMTDYSSRFKENNAMINNDRIPEDVTTFFEKNPLEGDAFAYAFGKMSDEEVKTKDQKVQDLHEQVQAFKALKGHYDLVKDGVVKEIEMIKVERDRALAKNRQERDRYLNPYKTVKEQAILRARNARVRTLRQQRVVHGRVPVGEDFEIRQFKQKMANINRFYTNITKPVIERYDMNKREIRKWARGEIHTIAKSHDNLLHKFVPQIKRLLQAYDFTQGVKGERPDLSQFSDAKSAGRPEVPANCTAWKWSPAKYDNSWKADFGISLSDFQVLFKS